MTYTWNDSFSVGNQILDDQHKMLLRICQRVDECSHSNDCADEIHQVLNELMQYAVKHFLTEEKLLKACKFPMLDAHIEEHREYEETLTDLLMSATHGDIRTNETIEYVLRWWRDHILGSDRLYIPSLRKG